MKERYLEEQYKNPEEYLKRWKEDIEKGKKTAEAIIEEKKKNIVIQDPDELPNSFNPNPAKGSFLGPKE